MEENSSLRESVPVLSQPPVLNQRLGNNSSESTANRDYDRVDKSDNTRVNETTVSDNNCTAIDDEEGHREHDYASPPSPPSDQPALEDEARQDKEEDDSSDLIVIPPFR
jgi:hypothetical protein